MLKTISYLLAVSLLTFSYTNMAEAGRFSKCTAALGREGGKEARQCVTMTTPQENPNFFDSFFKNQCQPVKDKWNLRACQDAHNKILEKIEEDESEEK